LDFESEVGQHLHRMVDILVLFFFFPFSCFLKLRVYSETNKEPGQMPGGEDRSPHSKTYFGFFQRLHKLTVASRLAQELNQNTIERSCDEINSLQIRLMYTNI
jgi:hypothetical protein